jgi:ABC-type multidrug transport system ATPase subunit
MPILMKMPKFAPKPKTLLHNFNGIVQPGEMCLVLGRPGSGCSTFLKTISNEREGYLDIGGRVEYEGIEATEFKKVYRGEAAYNPEDDVHLPTLTVAQTLKFALSLKTPGKRLQGQKIGDFKEDVADLLLRMLNIPHTRNTLVGNAEVRGVSGGERKRVSIAEMMAVRPAVSPHNRQALDHD